MLNLINKPGYLHAIVTGQNTVENVMAYTRELGRECATRGVKRLLIEENLAGRRLETWDVYQIASRGGAQSVGIFDAIAYVDVNAHGDLMKFAETVANNRGFPMNVFATVADAESWLRQKIG
jgi:hypothetical protein